MSKNAFPMKGYGLTFEEMCGMTKRELFAAMAMQGLLTNREHKHRIIEEDTEYCVRIADALLIELAKEKST